MYSNSIVRMETDGIYISINVEAATEGICRSMQRSCISDATEHTHHGRHVFEDFDTRRSKKQYEQARLSKLICGYLYVCVYIFPKQS